MYILLTIDRTQFHSKMGVWINVSAWESAYADAMVFSNEANIKEYCTRYSIKEHVVAKKDDMSALCGRAAKYVPAGVHQSRRDEFIDRCDALIKELSEPIEPIILTEWMARSIIEERRSTMGRDPDMRDQPLDVIPEEAEFFRRAVKLWPKLVETWPWLIRFDQSN